MIPREQLLQYMHFAGDLARQGGQVTLRYFRQNVTVETKSDESPVTVADRETERLMRARIAEAFPDHGILGEEYGETNKDAEWRWIIDPIDGTKSFIHGVPLYTVLLALMHGDEPVVGVIHCPALDETVVAAVGLGCFYNGQPTCVSSRSDLAKARIHASDMADMMQRNPRFTAALLGKVPMGRTWGDAYGYLLVATGRAEAMMDPIMSLWDSAALKPVIEEAGGHFTDFKGEPTVLSPTALASNGLLHEALLELVKLDA